MGNTLFKRNACTMGRLTTRTAFEQPAGLLVDLNFKYNMPCCFCGVKLFTRKTIVKKI